MPNRRLHILPIVHSAADLGSLAEHVRRAAEGRLGPAAVAQREAAIARWWDDVAAWAEKLNPAPAASGAAPPEPLRIYQDGLPICAAEGSGGSGGVGGELRIVEELASAGSRNHAIVLSLLARGAILVGTESPELLVREYELAKAAAAGHADPRHADRARALLERRDRFIAERIAATLPAGAEGVLFIGALHDPAPMLPPDIEALFPLGRPRAKLAAATAAATAPPPCPQPTAGASHAR